MKVQKGILSDFYCSSTNSIKAQVTVFNSNASIWIYSWQYGYVP